MGGKNSFSGDFKRFFGRGLAILLPSIVTLWLLWQAFIFVFNNVAEPINRGLRTGVIQVGPTVVGGDRMPAWYTVTEDQIDRRAQRRLAEGLSEMRRDRLEHEIRLQQFRDTWRKHWYLNGLGLVVAIILIYLAGLLLGNYLGKSIYTRIESLIAKIPGFKQVYPHVKQVVDLIFGENSTMKAFSEVVLLQYPSKGIWTVGLVTGKSFAPVRDAAGGETISVFIPTSPTPMTGFVINVLRSETIKLDITIEQAIRFVITAGVLTPEQVGTTGEIEDGKPGSKPARAQHAAEKAIAERTGDA